jgi:hypothetical protein
LERLTFFLPSWQFGGGYCVASGDEEVYFVLFVTCFSISSSSSSFSASSFSSYVPYLFYEEALLLGYHIFHKCQSS